MKKEILIQNLYNSFNLRDIDGILVNFAPDVEWPNGWEGGYLHGHDQVREYWTRQWKELNPVVSPFGFKHLPNGKLEVQVHQLVKDLEGKVLNDGPIYHLYTFKDDKIQRMDIEARG